MGSAECLLSGCTLKWEVVGSNGGPSSPEDGIRPGGVWTPHPPLTDKE